MHDCPACKVPLHGHEEVCPSCGTKQYVRPEYRRFGAQPKQPGVNPVPFLIFGAIVVVVGIFALQGSWITQLWNRGPVQEDPMSKLTPPEARNIIETEITKGLTAVGAKAEFKYTATGQPTTKDNANVVELTVNTSLPDPSLRRSIVDPVKEYMERGKIQTLTMNDAKSHATWTYQCNAQWWYDKGDGAAQGAPPPQQDSVQPAQE